MTPNQNANVRYQINNNRIPYNPNQMQNMNQVNQMQNQQNLYQRNPQGQFLQPNVQAQYQQQTAPLRQGVQNPIANQIPQRGINNNINNINNQQINHQANQPHFVIRPGQINNMPKPLNPPPNQVPQQRQIYQVRPGQPLNPAITPQNQQRNRVVTPQKNVIHNNYPNSNLQNGKKIV